MINDIIIDKLRLYIPKDRKELFYSGKNDFLSFAKLYFPKNSYRTYTRYKYFFIEFNPSRFRSPASFAKFDDDFNIQMIPEDILLTLFQKLGTLRPYVLRDFKIAELHITKNYVVNESINKYTGMLAEIRPKNQFKPILYKKGNVNNLYFSRLTRNKNINEYTDKRIIKFYDKKAHLLYKDRKKVSKIKLRESLSKTEKEILESAYDSKNNTLNLTNVNLLRIELAYKNSRALKTVYKSLDGSLSNYKSLPLGVLVKHLEKNTLYSELNKLFLNELRENIFLTDANEDILIEGKGCRRLLPLLKSGESSSTDSDLYYVKNILKRAGLDSQIANMANNINKGLLNNKYYSELYELIFDTPMPEQDSSLDDYPYCIRCEEEEEEKKEEIFDFDIEEYLKEFED